MATREPVIPVTPKEILERERVMRQNHRDMLLTFVNQTLDSKSFELKAGAASISVYPDPQDSSTYNLWVRWVHEIRQIYEEAGWKVSVGLHDVPYERVASLEFST